MRSASNDFKTALASNSRRYLCKAVITLSDNTTITLENAVLSGVKYEDAVSAEGAFDALGSVIINSAELTILNLAHDYTGTDFTGGVAVLSIGLTIGNSSEYVIIGTYVIDDASYTYESVRLSLLDYMSKFDKPYDSSLTYPKTLAQIVSDACTNCGVTLYSSNFPNYDYSVAIKPSSDGVTYRQVISWAAQIAGCFARCDEQGQLVFKWFGDWTNAPHFESLYSQDMALDDTVITGVRVLASDTDANYDPDEPITGTDDYVIEVSNNAFIASTNVSALKTYLGNLLIGLTFRRMTITCPSTPLLEAGDTAIVKDRNGVNHNILVCATRFGATSKQTIISSSLPVERNSATQYPQSTRNYIKLRDKTNEQIKALGGMYEYTEPVAGGGYIYYLHNKPVFSESNIRLRVTSDGVAITANALDPTPTWYGLTVDGNFIANILKAYQSVVVGLDTGSHIQINPNETNFYGTQAELLGRIRYDGSTTKTISVSLLNFNKTDVYNGTAYVGDTKDVSIPTVPNSKKQKTSVLK